MRTPRLTWLRKGAPYWALSVVFKKQVRSEFQNGRNLGTCLCMWSVGSNGDSEAEGLAPGHKAHREMGILVTSFSAHLWVRVCFTNIFKVSEFPVSDEGSRRHGHRWR